MSIVKAGVIGHPVSHSKSPVVHEYWIDKYNLSGTYEKIDITEEELSVGIQKLIDDGYAGFNVTVPHKQNIIPLCDEIDETAKLIGAVNTVKISDGKLYGFNTDAYGFIENLKSHDADIEGKTAFVLGAGGASRAVVYGLLDAGAGKVLISNRTKEKCNEISMINPDKIQIIDWTDRNEALDGVDILVNTTSLGMAGQPSLGIDLSALPAAATVSDIVYAPLMTELLKSAQGNGNKIVTGIGMLLHQARPAFEKWFGVLPEVTEDLEALVLK